MRYSPQEIEVWYVLPEIRKQLALALKKKGFAQKEIAKKLGVTEPAVSQYMKKKRAGHYSLGKSTTAMINNCADKISSRTSNADVMKEIQLICTKIRKNCTLCKIHKKLEEVPCNCRVCMGADKHGNDLS